MGIFMLILLFLLTMSTHGHGSKILFVSIPFRSHFTEIEGTARTLKERGHEVYIFAASIYADDITQKGYNVIRLDTPNTITDEIVQMRLDFGRNFWKLFTDARSREISTAVFNSMATDEVVKKIKHLNIDLLVIDILSMVFNGYVIPIELNLPYITSSAQIPFCMVRSNAMSYQTPHVMTPFLMNVGNDHVTRAANHVIAVLFDIITPYAVSHHKLLFEKLKHRSLADVVLKSRAFLLHQIPQLDFSYPLMPNVFAVGGGVAEKAANSPLPNDLASFMDGASKEGVIIMSLGSQVPFLPRDIAVKFAEAFGQLPIRVVLRDTGAHATSIYPANVKVMKWLPQAELLAHKNTKLFITHGGNNGQMESFANSVPMIVIPNASDQAYNGLRCVVKGYGLVLHFYDFQPRELVDAVNAILSNSSVRERMRRDFVTWKSRYSPASNAADVVEAAIRQETDYLAPTDHHDVNLLQFHMVDCVAFVMGVLAVLVGIVVSAARRLFSLRT